MARKLEPTGRIQRTTSSPPAGLRIEDRVLLYLPEIDGEVFESEHIRGLFINATRRMSRADYLGILRSQRERIANGLAFDAWDCDDTGNKGMSCSWGMCSNDPAVFPEAKHHVWPLEFLEKGRQNNIALPNKCPLDPRPDHGRRWREGDGHDQLQGCFWKCRVFQGRSGVHVKSPPLSRADVLALYDEKIAHVEAMVDVPYDERESDDNKTEILASLTEAK